MKRTTIFMPEDLERDLYAYARRSGKPAAAIVREAIAAYVAEGAAAATLPSFAGAFDSGLTDTAERHDELLFRRLTPHGDQALPAKRASRRSPSQTAARSRKRR